MRSLSYVQHVSLDFTGTLFPRAICLGEADNDSLNELIVGDTSGKLHVYKNDDSKPWITRTCVGMLTCVGVGDICNYGRNFVVAVGAEGWFNLFDLSAVAGAKSDSSAPASRRRCSLMTRNPASQHISASTKVILISDIDGDGRSELVVGYTDRVVRAFSWEEPTDSSDLGSGQLVLLKEKRTGFGLSREFFLATVLLHLHCLLFGVLGWVSVQHFEISADVRRAI
uniref:Integrin alpha FG-GAP repeat containing 2 n=1 Tax=Oncorhynchus kisutch TaxID=8019 RepID=A0A8C7HCS9_ONCKI